MTQIALIFQRVGLRECASVGMTQQADLPQIERLAHRLDIFDHVLDGVAGGILQLLGSPGAAFVNKYQAVMARQRQKKGQEIIVRCTRTAVHDQQRLAAAKRLVVDHDAVGVDETFLGEVDARGGIFGSVHRPALGRCGSLNGLGREREANEESRQPNCRNRDLHGRPS